MRLLLDESLPRRLGLPVVGHDVFKVAEAGCVSATNQLEDLAPLIPRILELLPRLRAGQSAEIS